MARASCEMPTAADKRGDPAQQTGGRKLDATHLPEEAPSSPHGAPGPLSLIFHVPGTARLGTQNLGAPQKGTFAVTSDSHIAAKSKDVLLEREA